MLSPAQLDMRRTRLGGSDAPALFGFDKYRTAVDVWCEKTGRAPPFVGNRHTVRGDFLEDGIACWAAHELGVDPGCLQELGSLEHPELEHVLATPDRTWDGDVGLVVMQVKAPSLNSCKWGTWKGWREGPPAKVHCQLQWEMGVLEARGFTVERGVCAALIGDEVKTWWVDFESDTARALHERGNEWFRRYVLTGEEPTEKTA